MRPLPYPFTLGIVGGGQLGRMLIHSASRMGLRTAVLDPDPAAACAGLADRFLVGSLQDPAALEALAAEADLLTYEIEHIDVSALTRLEAEGSLIRPSPAVLAVIQDKLKQKNVLAAAGVPTARFQQADDPAAWLAGRAAGSAGKAPGQEGSADQIGFPMVQKTRLQGYDGRGVKLLRSADDAPLAGPSIFEERVEIERELAVLVALGAVGNGGERAVFPVVEMSFHGEKNVCDAVLMPARLDQATSRQAREIGMAAVEALACPGLYAVELFLAVDGRILVNEIAPRPHNSGHLTIEACTTSQFEQHIRAVAGLPLGDTGLHGPAVMVNLLGQPGWRGRPVVEGLAGALAVPGLSFHFYGKTECRPWRKMGHYTVRAATLEQALHLAEAVRPLLRIRGSEPIPDRI